MSKGIISIKDEKLGRLFDKYDRVIDVLSEKSSTQKSTNNFDCLYSEKELCGRLKICRRTLNEYRRDGSLSYIRLGGKILYRESDIQSLLKQNYIKAYK